jgi:hypothetical protein
MMNDTAGLPNIQIHYAEEWAALYVNGDLVERTVGDSYLAEEHALDILGVIQIHDDAFMRGQDQRIGVAKTLVEVEVYRIHRDATKANAEQLRTKAARLLAEAEELDPQ